MLSNMKRPPRWHSGLLVALLTLCIVWELATPVEAYSTSTDTTLGSFQQITNSSVNSFNGITTYKLNYKNYKLVKGKSFVLKVLKLPTRYKVTYRSSDNTIARVNSRGTVTGIKNGTATITAIIKCNNLILRKLPCKVTVGPAAVSIVIPKSKITLKVKEKEDLKPIIKPKSSTETPKFKSSNSKIVSVSSKGIITAKREGTAVITATIANKKYDVCTVTVKKATSVKAASTKVPTVKKSSRY